MKIQHNTVVQTNSDQLRRFKYDYPVRAVSHRSGFWRKIVLLLADLNRGAPPLSQTSDVWYSRILSNSQVLMDFIGFNNPPYFSDVVV